IVRSQRTASARLAVNYVQAFRTLELGATTAAPVVVADTVAPAAVSTSMLVTGPYSVRANLARGMSVEAAMSIAEAASAGAGLRHALKGGRDTIRETVDRDDQALGWARATSGDPCSFCAMLASRGPAYKGED